MKKITLRLSLLVGLLLLLTAAVLAAEPLEGSAALDGSSYTVTVGVTAETEITSGRLELTYDASKLTLVSALPSNAMRDSVCTVNADESGRITFVFLQTAPLQGKTLLSVAFEAADGTDEAAVQVAADELYLRTTPVDGGTLELKAEKPAEPEKPCDGGADCPSRPYSDVITSQWYHPGVDFAISHGLMNGVGNGKFDPDGSMTRAMIVTVLWRYAGSPDMGTNHFTDVPSGQWYTQAVAWAAENGVVNGVGGGRFDPMANITREQMAAILFRYAQKTGVDTSGRADLSGYPDENRVSAYAKDALAWANAAELIKGTAEGSRILLDPQGNATRAQVATIFMRFIQNVIG